MYVQNSENDSVEFFFQSEESSIMCKHEKQQLLPPVWCWERGGAFNVERCIYRWGVHFTLFGAFNVGEVHFTLKRLHPIFD